jgi:hypothetical protein
MVEKIFSCWKTLQAMVVKCQPRAKDVKIFVFKPSAAFQSVSEYSIATPVLPFKKNNRKYWNGKRENLKNEFISSFF